VLALQRRCIFGRRQSGSAGNGLHELASAIAGAVVLPDSPLDNNPRFVQHKYGWESDPVLVIACLDPEGCMVCLQITIQQPELGDDAAARIRQERELDPSRAGKFAKRLLGIVTDPDQGYAAANKLPVDPLQLN
jgi:hypothetical protein